MKKSISINLSMSEIIYDIQNKTYLTGRSVGDKSSAPHVANMQANDDEENEAQVLRSVTMAISLLRNRLAEYLDNSDVNVNNEPYKTGEEVSFTLYMPSNFNGSVSKVLGQAAHQFIVASAIADWFAITARGETADYTVAAQEALRAIEEALCKRNRPVRG